MLGPSFVSSPSDEDTNELDLGSVSSEVEKVVLIAQLTSDETLLPVVSTLALTKTDFAASCSMGEVQILFSLQEESGPDFSEIAEDGSQRTVDISSFASLTSSSSNGKKYAVDFRDASDTAFVDLVGILGADSDGLPAFKIAIVIDMFNPACSEPNQVDSGITVDFYGCEYCSVNSGDPACRKILI